jgi:nitrogen fixation protein
LTFIDSIVRDENGNVSLVNDEATPLPNYYYGTDDEGVRGWYLTTDNIGLTCETIGDCQTIIDIEAAIDALEEEILLKANTADLGAVAFSNDYNDLDNKPTIPDVSGFVPYVGATTDVDLGTHNLTADHIALNVSPSGAGYVVGATRWNNTIGSSETLLKGGSVSLKNGVDLVARVVNKVTPNTTLTKAAYQAVRVSGAQGQRLAVELAQANNDNNSADTIGIVCETIATNQEGFIQTVGQLESINTTGSLQGETWTDGDVLYLSPTTAGRLTNIKPTGATGHIVVIGYVEYAHANNGKIYVKIMNGWELDELHNVYISSPANNNVLTYESSTSLWKNKTVETALGYTPVPTTRTLTINGTTQDLSANRTFTIATGLTVGTTPITSGAVGRVLFEGTGNVLQESANLFWDNTNSRLGIGTASPLNTLDVAGTVRLLSGSSSLTLNNATFSELAYGTTNYFRANGSSAIVQGPQILFLVAAIERARIFATTGNVGIGTTTDAGFKLDVNGTARVSGTTTITPATLTGTGSTSALDISQTWNTTGTPIALKVNITDTASAALSDLISLQVGGSVRFRVLKSGFFALNGSGEILGSTLIGGTAINASSQLEVRSTTKGFLPPRMTTTQKNAIASPAAGLMVYDTTLNLMSVYNGTIWISL